MTLLLRVDLWPQQESLGDTTTTLTIIMTEKWEFDQIKKTTTMLKGIADFNQIKKAMTLLATKKKYHCHCKKRLTHAQKKRMIPWDFS